MIKSQPIIREFINHKFLSAKGNWDLYIPFHEQAIKILKTNGIKSFITPNKWLSIAYANELRLLYINLLYKICNCNDIKVFDAGVSPVISFFKKCDTFSFSVDTVNSNFEFNTSYILSSKEIDETSLGILLSNYSSILLKIKKIKNRFRDFITCENPFSTSEAYKLCDIIIDKIKPNQKFFKLINTGTIDPFISLWGVKLTTYLKTRYTYPVAHLTDFKELFPKRLIQVQSPKLIITGMRYLECYYDEEGEYIAGKSTLIIREIKDNKFNLFCALINSKLVSFYIKQSFSSLGIDGGVNFTKDIIEDVPLPIITKHIENKITDYVSDIKLNNKDSEFAKQQIDNLIYKLYELAYNEVKLIDPEFSLTAKEYDAIKID